MQHRMSEVEFWCDVGMDPLAIATLYYAAYGGDGGRAKGPRKIKPRKPRDQRKKIQSRGFR
jgi:hypothetical protein